MKALPIYYRRCMGIGCDLKTQCQRHTTMDVDVTEPGMVFVDTMANKNGVCDAQIELKGKNEQIITE